MIKGKISILMGIYNCADTLEEAVQSILNQTYTNWQMIMCDDCSTDNTYTVAERIARRWPDKFILIRNERNMKLQYTLNHCLLYADGEYIARMDGDDTCSPDRFEKEITFLNTHPEYALVSCNMSLFDKDGEFRLIHYSKEPTRKSFLVTSQFCHAGCMMRTSVMKELGGYSEEANCERVEDYDLWVRLYAAGYKGYNIQETLYAMRDDRNAVRRRTLRNRVNESSLKIRAGKLLGYRVAGYAYAAVPIIKAMIPDCVYRRAHRQK